MKKQVVVIHGGHTFFTYDEYLSYLKNTELDFESLKNRKNGWKRNLTSDLEETFEVIAPRMPNGNNVKYIEWKVWFEKLIPYLDEEVIFVGHSLGGIFLTKYLSEENYPKTIKGVFLVGAPFGKDQNIAEFTLPESLERLSKQGGSISFYHSKDDPIVPFKEMDGYRRKIPQARFVDFEDREHFFDEHFPELVRDIQDL